MPLPKHLSSHWFHSVGSHRFYSVVCDDQSLRFFLCFLYHYLSFCHYIVCPSIYVFFGIFILSLPLWYLHTFLTPLVSSYFPYPFGIFILSLPLWYLHSFLTPLVSSYFPYAFLSAISQGIQKYDVWSVLDQLSMTKVNIAFHSGIS